MKRAPLIIKGGAFDYAQHIMADVAACIEQMLEEVEFPDDDVRDCIQETARTCRIASKMLHRVDYLITSEDTEVKFLRLWKQEITEAE